MTAEQSIEERPAPETAVHRSTDEAVVRSRRGRRAALVALLVVTGTVLQLLRQPGVPSWDSHWQEDGMIFLRGAVNNPWGSVTATYNGYLHVVPRLIALAFAPFPLEWSPLLYSATTALLVSLIAWYVWTVSAAFFRTRWARGLLAAHLVLLPAAAYEVNADLANLHWYLIYGAFWALLDRPPNRRRTVVAVVVVLSAAVSDSLTGLLLPLVLLRALRGRLRERIVCGAWVLGMAVQLLVTSTPPKPYTEVRPWELPATYGFRVAGSFLFGDRYLLDLRDAFGGAPFHFTLLAAVLLLAIATVLLLRRSVRPDLSWLAAGAFAYSVAFLTIPLLLRGTYLLNASTLNGARYEVLPVLFLGIVALLAVERFGAVDRAGDWPFVQVAATVVLVGGLVVNFSTTAVRSAGPSWSASVDAARALCTGQPPPRTTSPVRLGRNDTVVLPASPASATRIPFPTPVPCSRLR